MNQTKMGSTSIDMTMMNSNVQKEYNINWPTSFTGDRTKIENFLQECDVYLNINNAIYNNNVAKIAFVLSFITAGEAHREYTMGYPGVFQGNLCLYPSKPAPRHMGVGFEGNRSWVWVYICSSCRCDSMWQHSLPFLTLTPSPSPYTLLYCTYCMPPPYCQKFIRYIPMLWGLQFTSAQQLTTAGKIRVKKNSAYCWFFVFYFYFY